MPVFPENVDSTAIRTTINTHIEESHILRLLVWDIVNGGQNPRARTVGFANFRLHGHNLSGEGSWLLLEFVDWDTTCGQAEITPSEIILEGDTTGLINTTYSFTAVTSPTITTQPITYSWQATNQTPITQTGGLTDTISFSWPMTGTQIVTVTAVNSLGSVTTSHHITITTIPTTEPKWQQYLPFITTNSAIINKEE